MGGLRREGRRRGGIDRKRVGIWWWRWWLASTPRLPRFLSLDFFPLPFLSLVSFSVSSLLTVVYKKLTIVITKLSMF